jgi:hypothetical protein
MKNWDIFVAGVSILPAVSTGGRPTGFEDVIQCQRTRTGARADYGRDLIGIRAATLPRVGTLDLASKFSIAPGFIRDLMDVGLEQARRTSAKLITEKKEVGSA